MNDSLVPVVVGAVVGGGFAVVGSLITGWLTYVSSVRRRETESYRRQLIQACEDIAAFHRLEHRYAERLATTDASKTTESWKRQIRREQRRAGDDTPSENATAKHAEQQIQKLRDRQIT
ncbi:MAG TPA: hypothetical protein VG105_02860 [Paraburkholderia sp.]|jgi:hypothetical protein|nr:hypothetical protein [Paraburkholderia sp.]